MSSNQYANETTRLSDVLDPDVTSVTINGNNADEIRKALDEANAETEKPTLIIGKTIMGKGAVTPEGENFEGQCSTHGQPLSGAGASFEKTIENLGGNASNPFVVFPEVAEKVDT